MASVQQEISPVEPSSEIPSDELSPKISSDELSTLPTPATLHNGGAVGRGREFLTDLSNSICNLPGNISRLPGNISKLPGNISDNIQRGARHSTDLLHCGTDLLHSKLAPPAGLFSGSSVVPQNPDKSVDHDQQNTEVVTLRVNVRVGRGQGRLKVRVNVGVMDRVEEREVWREPLAVEDITDQHDNDHNQIKEGEEKEGRPVFFPPPYHTDVRRLGETLEGYETAKHRLATLYRNQVPAKYSCSSTSTDDHPNLHLFSSLRRYLIAHGIEITLRGRRVLFRQKSFLLARFGRKRKGRQLVERLVELFEALMRCYEEVGRAYQKCVRRYDLLVMESRWSEEVEEVEREVGEVRVIMAGVMDAPSATTLPTSSAHQTSPAATSPAVVGEKQISPVTSVISTSARISRTAAEQLAALAEITESPEVAVKTVRFTNDEHLATG